MSENEKIPVLNHHAYYIRRDYPGIIDFKEALEKFTKDGHSVRLNKLRDKDDNLMYPNMDTEASDLVMASFIVAVNTGNAKIIRDEGHGTEGSRDAMCGPCGNVVELPSGVRLCSLDQ